MVVKPATTHFIAIIGILCVVHVNSQITTLGCDPKVPDSEQCPPFSACREACPLSSGDFICQCDRRKLFFKDMSSEKFECFTIVRIDEPCNSTHRCPGRESQCWAGKCRCRTPFQPTSSLTRCKPRAITSPLVATSFSALGEPCNPTSKPMSNVCLNAEELECVAGSCRCKPGLRPASRPEMIKFHNVGFYCRPNNVKDLRDFYFAYN